LRETGYTLVETRWRRDPLLAGEIGRIWNVDAVKAGNPLPAQGDPLECSSIVVVAKIPK
jgi:hypothetical protein